MSPDDLDYFYYYELLLSCISHDKAQIFVLRAPITDPYQSCGIVLFLLEPR